MPYGCLQDPEQELGVHSWQRQSPEALAGLGDPAGCSCSEEPEREMSQHHMRKGWLEINSDEAGDDIALEGLW